MIEARFRRRAGSEDVQTLHASIQACLLSISWMWKTPRVNLALESNGESAACDLSSCLREGVSGSISYSARFPGAMRDKATFDDVLTLQIDEDVVEYGTFVNKIFCEMVSCFNAYRAAIVLDLDLDLDDYDVIVKQSQLSGKDVDGRDSVFRINPVNFFDGELCIRAFGQTADQIANALRDGVERVTLQSGGLLLIVTSELVDRENLRAVHDHVASLLSLDRRASDQTGVRDCGNT